MLLERARQQPEQLKVSELELLTGVIERRRSALRQEALRSAARLYRHKPRKLLHRLALGGASVVSRSRRPGFTGCDVPRGNLPWVSMLELRQLSRPECFQLLAANQFGRLAVNVSDHAPAIRPVNYIFDERSQSVVFRTAHGSKLYGLLASRKAAFEIDGVDPESRTGWSVIVVGITEEITNPLERERLDAGGLQTWAPGEKSHWVRIRAWSISGRRIVDSEGVGCDLGVEPEHRASIPGG